MWFVKDQSDTLCLCVIGFVSYCSSQLHPHSSQVFWQGFGKGSFEIGTLKCSWLHFIQASFLLPYTSYPAVGNHLLYSEHWSQVRTVLTPCNPNVSPGPLPPKTRCNLQTLPGPRESTRTSMIPAEPKTSPSLLQPLSPTFCAVLMYPVLTPT